MPTRASSGLPGHAGSTSDPDVTGAARLSNADRAARVRFRRAVTLMLMTLLIPGSAQLVAGDRRVGRIAIRVWLVALAVSAVLLAAVTLRHQLLFSLGSNTTLLLLVRLLLIVLALGWAALLVDAWRLGQPLALQQRQRLAAVGLNAVLTFTVAGTLLFGAHLAGVQRDFMLAMFGDGAASGAHDGRYNVLLLGGDSGTSRWGLRADSITIASIDAVTGKTVLIGLPRNLANFPFAQGSVMDRQFPDGFDCEGCILNGVTTWAGDHTDLFPHSKNPGVDATVMAVEGITGLQVNYWAMVNLQGFKDLVDAVGGVTLNVRQAIPVGLPGDPFYHQLQPGVRKLNGFDTLWFARSRESSDDYSRMARQKCVMSAMLDQISPRTALTSFEQIARASSAMVSTSVPRSEVGRFADLALKARRQKIATVSLVPPLITTADPDIDRIRELIDTAIGRSDGSLDPAPKQRRKKDTGVTGGSLGNLSEGYAANQADDLAASC